MSDQKMREALVRAIMGDLLSTHVNRHEVEQAIDKALSAPRTAAVELTDAELPPLPGSSSGAFSSGPSKYYARQMRQYGRACIAADRKKNGRGGRDCGCAHYWNCPSLNPAGEKPVMRLASASSQPGAAQEGN